MKMFRKRSLRSAFTIVELLIAVSVMGILAGVAVPRYNSVMRQIEYDKSVQSIVECLQTAQNYAANPGLDNINANIRYYMAQLTVSNCNITAIKNSSVDTSSAYTTITPGSSVVTIAVANSVVPKINNLTENFMADSANLSISADCGNTPIDLASKFVTFLFGTVEKGAPIRVMTTGTCSELTATFTNKYYTQSPSISFIVDQADSTITDRTITINSLGKPINSQ